MNYGEFEETTAEAQGLTGRTFNAYSVSFGVSYAQYLIPQFTIGGTAKVVYEQIAKVQHPQSHSMLVLFMILRFMVFVLV